MLCLRKTPGTRLPKEYFRLRRDIFLLVLLVLIGASKSLIAADLGSGLVAIEDGDDRMRPAALLHLGTNAGFVSRFYVYGRDYGPVEERNFLLSLDKRFDLAGKTWQGIVGLAALYDMTTIEYDDHPEDNMNYSSSNFGAAFGIHWTFLEAKRFRMQATWDGHVFPAGTGFLFLANARKSAIGITASTVF